MSSPASRKCRNLSWSYTLTFPIRRRCKKQLKITDFVSRMEWNTLWPLDACSSSSSTWSVPFSFTQICTMVKNVIIVTITIILIFVSWVLQALCDYFISHLTCPPSCHQARFSMLLIAIRLKTNYILFTISITRATLSVANPGVGETQS